MGSDHFDIFEIYARYRGMQFSVIFPISCHAFTCLWVDSRQFNCFYDFVFFGCRENGQKNITVTRAISAWRLVLTGRFRLLDQWCNFVERHQKHNISEDTWQQLLAFSRYVNEDLDGYDPKGAWPVLIDDFVEHMYRINQSNNCSSQEFCCSCGDMETPGIPNTFSGLNLLPGSKRKLVVDTDGQCDVTPMSCENYATQDHLMKPKRAKQMQVPKKYRHWDADLDMSVADGTVDSQADANRHNSLGCLQTSPSACAVEDCLSKGFEGHLSISRCFQFDQKSRLSCI